MAAHYFPAHTDINDYTNNPTKLQELINKESELLPPALIESLDKTGRKPTPGDVRYIFLTKVGSGPIRQPAEEHLINTDGETVEAGPKHKRMKIN